LGEGWKCQKKTTLRRIVARGPRAPRGGRPGAKGSASLIWPGLTVGTKVRSRLHMKMGKAF
jgi:hypothetical protein